MDGVADTPVAKAETITEEKKDELWQGIKERAGLETKTEGLWIRGVHGIKLFIENFGGGIPIAKVGFAMSFVLMLLLPLFIVELSKHGKTYVGEKGDSAPAAAVEYALVEKNGLLVRPERPLSEDDTIAFRLSAGQKGYCSLFMVNGRKIDTIFENNVFEKGVHDLTMAYVFKGNIGKNFLILAASDTKINQALLKEHLSNQKHIDKKSDIILSKSSITLSAQEITVHKSE